MDQTVNIAKALADPTRLRILLALKGRELCACELIALIGLAPSTVSKHLSLLTAAGLVKSRKLGRWVHFREAGEGAPRAVRLAAAWAYDSLQRDAQVKADRVALKCARCAPKEGACRIPPK